VRDHVGKMRRANVRGHTRGLPNSEIIDDLVSMRRRVERKVLDHHVVAAKQVDYLGGLGLVEGAYRAVQNVTEGDNVAPFNM